MREIDPAMLETLANHQRRDQESADREEQVNAQLSTVKQWPVNVDTAMVPEHREYAQTAQAVETAESGAGQKGVEGSTLPGIFLHWGFLFVDVQTKGRAHAGFDPARMPVSLLQLPTIQDRCPARHWRTLTHQRWIKVAS